MTTTSTLEPDFILEADRPFGDDTPWGKPDGAFEIAPGIWRIDTPRHGGYWLSPERHEAMPELLQRCSVTGDNWFEEDYAWVAVALAFPELEISCSTASEKLQYLAYALMDELGVCHSTSGYYIGHCVGENRPDARDSVEYWQDEEEAMDALFNGTWTLRLHD